MELSIAGAGLTLQNSGWLYADYAMDLLTGLLLMSVIIWIAYIVVLGLLDESITEALAKYFRSTENHVESSLVGSVGRIVDVDSGENDQFKVRIGIELWSAKLGTEGAQLLSIGTNVRVTAVNGMLLDVEEHLAD